jgi:subfamily B ATP-binding cassette protein MsbA
VGDLARLFGYVRPYYAHIAIAVVLMAVVGASYGLFALLLEPLLDRFLSPDPVTEPVELFKVPFMDAAIMLDDLLPAGGAGTFGLFCWVFLLVAVAKGLCDYTASCLVNYAGYSAVRDIRNEMYGVVLGQSPAFFQTKHTGELISSLVSDIERIQSACSHFLADLMRQLFTTLALLFVLLQHDPILTLGCVVVLPLVLFPASQIGRRLRRTSTRTQEHLAQLVKIMQETISGNRIVKAFAMESFEVRRFRDRADRWFEASMRMVKQQAVVSPLIEMLGAAMILGLLIYVRGRILAGGMTAGQVVSFIVALVIEFAMRLTPPPLAVRPGDGTIRKSRAAPREFLGPRCDRHRSQGFHRPNGWLTSDAHSRSPFDRGSGSTAPAGQESRPRCPSARWPRLAKGSEHP